MVLVVGQQLLGPGCGLLVEVVMSWLHQINFAKLEVSSPFDKAIPCLAIWINDVYPLDQAR